MTNERAYQIGAQGREIGAKRPCNPRFLSASATVRADRFLMAYSAETVNIAALGLLPLFTCISHILSPFAANCGTTILPTTFCRIPDVGRAVDRRSRLWQWIGWTFASPSLRAEIVDRPVDAAHFGDSTAGDAYNCAPRSSGEPGPKAISSAWCGPSRSRPYRPNLSGRRAAIRRFSLTLPDPAI